MYIAHYIFNLLLGIQFYSLFNVKFIIILCIVLFVVFTYVGRIR